MNDRFYAVILAGGKGERFWPLSTSRRPKQLLSLFGDRTLLAQAVDRLDGLIPPERILVITNAALVDATRAAAPTLPARNVIGEPVGRDTAAAVALAAALVGARRPDAAFCILTADQLMEGLDVFRGTLAEGLHLALEQDVLVTIGITPAEPSTSFGYIHSGERHSVRAGIEFYRARRFVEKPDATTARQYVAEGCYYWNAGMFLWSVASVTAALRKHCPRLFEMIERLRPDVGTPSFDAALAREYADLPKISVDYALMEKSENILMARGTFPWDDVGSWPAIAAHLPKDEAGNVAVGDVELLGSADNIVLSQGRLTAVIGLKDVVVVQADGVTLVCARDRAQDVKKMVEQVKAHARHPELL